MNVGLPFLPLKEIHTYKMNLLTLQNMLLFYEQVY